MKLNIIGDYFDIPGITQVKVVLMGASENIGTLQRQQKYNQISKHRKSTVKILISKKFKQPQNFSLITIQKVIIYWPTLK